MKKLRILILILLILSVGIIAIIAMLSLQNNKNPQNEVMQNIIIDNNYNYVDNINEYQNFNYTQNEVEKEDTEDKEEIEETKYTLFEFIKNYDTTNEEMKNELTREARMQELEEWQANYGYISELLVTIIFEENITVENLDVFLGDLNKRASIWKSEGYTSIKQIAEDYVNDETASEWANNIQNKLKKNSKTQV